MAVGQRWKVSGDAGDGLPAREGREPSSRELPERLPRGAVVEELELADDCLRFKRVSGLGPLSGWVSLRSREGQELLSRLAAKREAPEAPAAPARRAKAPCPEPAGQPAAGVGREWLVVAPEGSIVWKGPRVASLKLKERLPCRCVVEEVECQGERLRFLNHTGVGPASGWVSVAEKGKEILQRIAEEPSEPSTSFEGMKRGFLSSPKAPLYPEAPAAEGAEGAEGAEPPLGGWADLSRLYGREVNELGPRSQPGAAVAAETIGRRRRREELPPVEDLEHLDEGSLVDLLGFDELTAREFAGLSSSQKKKMIGEAKALIEMGPEKRMEALESYKKAWPRGPFPELTPPLDEPTYLPPGSCFPYSRHLREVPAGPAPEWGLESPAGQAVRTFFRRRPTSSPEAQKEFLRSLRCEVAASASGAVRAGPGAVQADPCRAEGSVDKEQLAGTVAAKGAARPDDVLRYLNGELSRRVVLLDGGLGARLAQEKLGEADYRGERFKNFKEADASGKAVALQGNTELLSLTKASLIGDIHKEYLQAGADIIRTNTLGCNALAQQQYKMDKLVYEMNKAAAQLAKRATAEVTKSEPQKPRFVAGVIGPTPIMLSQTPGASWSDMVEAFDEQVKGLVDGGVDLLMVDGVADSANAKAAVFAIDEYFERFKKKRMPVLLSAQVADGGRLPGGQSAEAFGISLRHVKPLVLGVSTAQGPAAAKQHCRPLAEQHLGWCSAAPSAAGEDPEKFAAGALELAKEGLANLLGAEGALPTHIAALAKRLGEATPRKLPRAPTEPYLQLAGLDACHAKPEEGFRLVGSQCTVMGSAKFKKKVGAFKATGKAAYLQEALEVCLDQCEKGADILDFNLDSDMVSGPACPARSAMGKFLKVASAEPRVARVPFMLCSCEWDTIREGLRCVQGKCIVNGITLTLGEEEFLRIAGECQRHGAALVILAITDEGEPAESADEKVRICKRSYQLLRSKLDFPPEDIIFDCHVLLLGLPEFAARASEFINAVAELKRSCPGASFVGGVNNLSLPYRGLNMLRDALHSVFLYHAIPKGLNLAMTWPGALPVYSDIDAETRALCEEMVLNRSADGNHLERFNAFVSFRANSLTCLPLQHPGLSRWSTDDEGNLLKAPAVMKEAKETQQQFLRARKASSAREQKSYLRSLRCNVACKAEALRAGPGAGLPDACRVEGFVNREGLAGTVVAKGGVRPEDLARYFNAELRKRVCVFATPGAEKLSEAQYREYFSSGCDVCGTATLLSGSYEESKAAAQLAKSAAAEATKKDSQRPRFVAGVIGPTGDSLSSSPSAEDPSERSTTWDDLVASYTQQVRGLVEGGADLLALEAVSDTLNAKAAIFAVDEYFEQTRKERLPLLITAVISGGKVPSGQSLEALLISIRHAKPLSVGITGGSIAELKGASRTLADSSLTWCHVSGGAGVSADELASGLADLGGSKQLNFAGVCGASAAHVAAVAKKVGGAQPRALPLPPQSPPLQLCGLEPHSIKPEDGFQMVGQRCNLGGSAKFKGYVDAYKYTKGGNRWQFALDVCTEQIDAGADLLDVNFDSGLIDSRWAMGKFMRLCNSEGRVARVPFVLSSTRWPVIEEGLRNTQGKSVVNAISLLQGEEEFMRLARACQRYGAAVVVMTMDSLEEFPSSQDKVRIGQLAYKLLRTKLDFPAEDIIFDCNVLPVGGPENVRDFLDAVAELKRTCPLVSFIGGVSNLSMPYRAAPLLRQALHSVFLHHAIPVGLNMAIVDPGAVPVYGNIEAQTRKPCEDAVLAESREGGEVDQLEAFASFLCGAVAEAVPTALVPAADLPQAISRPMRASPGLTQPIHTLVQGTGTINASIFQTFGSKAHAALTFHKDQAGLAVKRSVWFSSISAWMGQGGSGPITGASCMMDGISLYERWQGFQNTGVSVEWGAIGEIGLRRTIYGSRDVFAQFDLGQKLIGPADTQFLMRACCCLPADPYEVIGMAYLDQTWQMTLAGVTSGGGLERKTFADM